MNGSNEREEQKRNHHFAVDLVTTGECVTGDEG